MRAAGNPVEAAARFDLAANAESDPSVALLYRSNAAACLWEAGSLAASARRARAAGHGALDLPRGDPNAAFVLVNWAQVELRNGLWERAEILASQAVERAGETGDDETAAHAWRVIAEANRLLGAHADAASALERAGNHASRENVDVPPRGAAPGATAFRGAPARATNGGRHGRRVRVGRVRGQRQRRSTAGSRGGARARSVGARQWGARGAAPRDPRWRLDREEDERAVLALAEAATRTPRLPSSEPVGVCFAIRRNDGLGTGVGIRSCIVVAVANGFARGFVNRVARRAPESARFGGFV